MRFLTTTLLLTLTSSLTISALPTVITRTDDLISRDGLELSKRAPEISAQEAEEDKLAAQIEKDIAMEEWGHTKRSPAKPLSAAELAQADAEEDEDDEDDLTKRAVSPANAALAKQIADSIAAEEAASQTKRSPSPAKKLSAAELAQADAEEEEDEEENEKRAVAVSAADAALAKQIADSIAEEEAASQTKREISAKEAEEDALAAQIEKDIAVEEWGHAKRSPAKKLSAAELAQADAEEEEDEEDN